VWYTLTVGSSTTVNISTCGSDFDSYLHILDQYGNELASNDDNGPLCVGNQASIRIPLSPGTYYVAVEGYAENCGNIAFMINNADLNYDIQAALITSINAGSFGGCGSRIFTDSRNNSSYGSNGNKYGNGSDDIFYRLTVTETSLINISLCGSNFDTYLYLLNESGAEIESNDDNGPLCSGSQSSIQTTLSPGTYYVVAEGFSFNSGDIALEITDSGHLPTGGSVATPIDMGTLSSPVSDTRNNSPESCYQNLMDQQPSNEIYYKFTLATKMEVSLSHCGTSFDTYMHLLDNSGTEITANNDNGPLCSGSQASIKMILNAGTYYVVSEGFGANSGDLTTSFSAVTSSGGSTGSNTGGLNGGLVGMSEGSASVSPGGAATYEMPIKLPPGTGGMVPQLSIVYNSQGSDGLLGTGFSISGLSAISRAPKNLFNDGIVAPVKLDASDPFVLDGNRLILVSGTYGADGSEYRTENNSFVKVKAVGNGYVGPDRFIVWTKSGLIQEYGNTDDSKIEASGR